MSTVSQVQTEGIGSAVPSIMRFSTFPTIRPYFQWLITSLYYITIWFGGQVSCRLHEVIFVILEILYEMKYLFNPGMFIDSMT